MQGQQSKADDREEHVLHADRRPCESHSHDENDRQQQSAAHNDTTFFNLP